MTACWIDCSAGIAGDMLLGALLDAGASPEVVRAAVRAVDPALDVCVERTQRHQIAATKVTVLDTRTGAAADGHHGHGHDHGHTHHHGHGNHEHGHRPWRDVRDLLGRAALDPRVRDRAHATFRALAEAEGAVHGMAPDDVEFHEVGALDAIGDVVGCAAAFVDLGVDSVTASLVTAGHGEQTLGAHGRIPVPGPAVTHLARAARMPLVGGPVAMEMTTPTGAALLAAWAGAYGPMPAMVVDRVGVGAGTRDPERLANVVRVMLGEALDAASPGDVERLVVLEANVDDLDPRLWPPALAALLAAGALDAWLTPILMKKGRPAHTLSVLSRPADRNALVRAMARHTTTLGVRERAVDRIALDRRMDAVDVAGHRVDVKVAVVDGEVVNAQPELEHCVRAATALDVPVGEVLARASAAWWTSHNAAG